MNTATITAQIGERHLAERLTIPFEQSHLVYLVSMGKRRISVAESHHLEATIDLVNKIQPKKVTVIIAGKLQRLSFWNSHFYSRWAKLPEAQLENVLENSALMLAEEAIKRGEEWQANNQAIFNSITSCKPQFLNWDDVVSLENYQKYQKVLRDLYEQDENYKSVLDLSAETYVSFHRKDIKNIEHRSLAKQRCIKYLLEESPLIIPPVLGGDYILYHAEPNAAMVEIYQRLYPGQPLPWFPLHYTFKAQKYDKFCHNKKLAGTSSLFHSKRQEKKHKVLVA